MPESTPRYRLALDLGSTSLGWAILRLNPANEPTAIIKAGVRIFSDGRNPKDGASLAVTRRAARAMRRRRDRLLKRKARMLQQLTELGFFPADATQRKALETSNPYALRAKGLDEKLEPAEFARALFHLNQRRGFKSNRKTDKGASDAGALKTAISQIRQAICSYPVGEDGKPLKPEAFNFIAWVQRELPETDNDTPRTVGELLNKRMNAGQTVRAKNNGEKNAKLRYDLYIDRAMIEAEFDALWSTQARFNPTLFTETARQTLKDSLLFQRNLRPVKPGRCTLMPEEERAPLALPSTQRFRIVQEVNNLRILNAGLKESSLTIEQRDALITALEITNPSFKVAIPKILKVNGQVQFNLADEKRKELKGNATSIELSKEKYFGKAWLTWSLRQQDAVVKQLINQQNLGRLVTRLMKYCFVDEQRAEAIANAALPEGYGSLSRAALGFILPVLQSDVISYAEAVKRAGENGAPFSHHSAISHSQETGEIMAALPYYGEALQRHVGFGTGDPQDPAEKRFGKIANPTVHIGLNQVRTVVNALIARYGHPTEVVIELARDLKQSRQERLDEQKQQAERQKKNTVRRTEIATALGISEHRVRIADIQKMALWEELSFDVADRRCPYTGEQISLRMLLSDEVEIEHILPFSKTLDDSLNNKTVALRRANRDKGNRTPWEAFGKQTVVGYDYAGIIARAQRMPKNKRYRFAEDGYQKWLKEDEGFLARALNDTRHLSKVAKEYLSLICPHNKVRAIPGRMTAMLRAKFGLNSVLGLEGEKNRNDHRHHAVDACVIGVTDQGLLQRFANASAATREQQLNRLVDNMPLPWDSYAQHVSRAIHAIKVSHKPDHGHEGAMHNDTAYGLLGEGRVSVHKTVDGVRTRVEDNLTVLEFANHKTRHTSNAPWHGSPHNKPAAPYKGYKGDSNYCIEIVRNEKGKWEGEVISTFEAYQLVREFGLERLRSKTLSVSGKPLVMRLIRDDAVLLMLEGKARLMRIATVNSAGTMAFAPLNEANVDARNRNKEDDFTYVYKTAGSLQKSQTRRVTISPIGELHDPGFKD